jgi:hypothetical protein
VETVGLEGHAPTELINLDLEDDCGIRTSLEVHQVGEASPVVQRAVQPMF